MNENVFVKLLQKIFENEGFLTQREIGVGYGIADLVVVKKNRIIRSHCKIRKNHGQISPLLGEEYFKILKVLPDENNQSDAVEFKYIAERSSLSDSYLKYKVLRELEDKGYVRRVGEKRYFKVNGWIPITKEIVAIEAKLKDWRRGAIQANRYKAFANRVYLAVPKETARLVDIKFLKKYDIGLISLDTSKLTKRVVVGCRSTKPFDEYKFNFAAEYFWSLKQLVNFA
jgi:hypothetical protein